MARLPRTACDMKALLLRVLYLCLSLHRSVQSPITNPHRSDADILKVIPDYFDSKRFGNYHNSTPVKVDDVSIIRYDKDDQSCNVNFKLKWSANVGSSVYATPVVFPAGAGGKKQIYMSTYYQYVEVLGYDGFKPWGWPISFEDSSFQGSPIIYDIDGDGTNDVGLVDKDANLHWIRVGEFGQYLDDFHVQVPRLKIKKNWADNMDPTFVDNYVATSMFDHKNFDEHSFGLREGESGGEGEGGGSGKAKVLPEGAVVGKGKLDDLALLRNTKTQESYPELPKTGGVPFGRRKLLEEAPLTHATDEHTFTGDSSHRSVEGEEKEGTEGEGGVEPQMPDFGDGLADPYTDGGRHPHDDFIPDQQRDNIGGDFYGRHFDYSYRYYMSGMYNETDYVFVDPHVLGNPVLADANNDGHLDVLMSVSYYFDKVAYQGKEVDFEPGNYIAGGVACWDLHNQEWSWMVHLDLTTDKTKHSAMIYGSPTVADLDGNGRNEVVVGTSLGLLYVLDGDSGFVRRHFPMQFGAIEASVAVADVHGGSDLEIIVADMRGNLVLVNAEGDVLWDSKLSGSIPHTPTVGDVDGDGQLDIVAVAVSDDGSSHVWAVDGATGRRLAGYPLALPRGGRVSSPVILADLHDYRTTTSPSSSSRKARREVVRSDRSLPPWLQDTPGHRHAASPSLDSTSAPLSVTGAKSKGLGLHLILPSYDGHIYVLDGLTGCAERIDVGEHIGAAPLIDDVTGNGLLDMLVATMNGQVLLMESDIPFHSMNAWPSFPKHRLNGFTHGQLGVSVSAREKRRLKYLEIAGGKNVTVSVDVWDSRPVVHSEPRRYEVTVHTGSAQETLIASHTFDRAGRFSLQLQLPAPVEGMFIIGMTTEHGQYFEDSVYIAVSTRFHTWLKYMVGAPLLCLVAPLLLMSKRR